MAMNLFNTLTRSKAPFMPIVQGKVKMYICGPTVYDDPHLGHARSAVIYDVVRRYLKARRHQVTCVRNITDIGEKIFYRACLRNQDYRTLGAHYIRRYKDTMARLNVLPPDAEPRASEFMRPIQDLIAATMQKGHAYQAGRNVYFAVASIRDYGRLSGRAIRPAPVGGDFPTRAGKRHPADFALWRESRPHEPSWPSPWGFGRPGWHIECSAMSMQFLGDVFDIHGGGEDLIFPHHENEIAQSLGIHGQIPARYWMHHGLVNIGGQKISKSLGNSPTLGHLLETYPPGALRLFLLSKCYRHPLEFSHAAMRAAARSFARLERFFSRMAGPAAAPPGTGKRPGNLWSRFCGAMDADFNFPMALAVVFEGIRRLNRILGTASQVPASALPDGLDTIAVEMAFMCREVLGFQFDNAMEAAGDQASDVISKLETV